MRDERYGEEKVLEGKRCSRKEAGDLGIERRGQNGGREA